MQPARSPDVSASAFASQPRLSRLAVQRALADSGAFNTPYISDMAIAPGLVPSRRRAALPAAVLVGVVQRSPEPTVLLTQRATHLRDHAGQISFPGGRIEVDDASPVAAALREAEEEVGLPTDAVEVIRELDPYDTVTGFRIHPIVGWVTPPQAYAPDPFEVAEVFEVPLSFVIDPRNHQERHHEHEGRQRRFFALPYGEKFIWGATAAILINFSRYFQPREH